VRGQSLAAGLLAATALVGCGRIGFQSAALLDGGGDATPDAPDDGSTDGSPPADASADARPPADGGDGGAPNPVSAISSGLSHSCAIAEGSAYCWGSNTAGQIGDGSTRNANTPMAVTGLVGTATFLDCGHFHTCALVDGSAYCWGRGGSGELGDGMGRDSATPVAVVGLTDRVTDISGGQDFTCAVAGGRAYCWGVDRQGSLGRVAAGNSDVPVAVELDTDLVQISSGQDHACAVAADRSAAYCWGHNDSGALGSPVGGGSRTPVRVELPSAVTRVTEITIGGWHTCARTDQGVFCWGTGDRGELGDGEMTSSVVPVSVAPFTTAASTTRISVNGNPSLLDASCVVASGGAVHCWGANTTGRMGDGTTDDRAVPTLVMGVTAELVATGVDHVCAADSTGRVFCWGAGDSGQLGTGASSDSLVAVEADIPW
jgi:alpha-tubulin suppressor-like RCC1 family protein